MMLSDWVIKVKKKRQPKLPSFKKGYYPLITNKNQ